MPENRPLSPELPENARKSGGYNLARRIATICLVAVGIGSVFAMCFAVIQSEWRPHFFNLLQRIWSRFQDAEGSATTGIVSNWLDPVIIIAIGFAVHWRTRGWRAVMQDKKQEAMMVLRVSFFACLVLYGPVFVWQLDRAVYADHQNLVGAARRIKVTAEREREARSSIHANIDMTTSGPVRPQSPDTMVIALISLENPTGPPTSLINWQMHLQSKELGDVAGVAPIMPVHLPVLTRPGRPEKFALDPAGFCMAIASQPIPTGGAKGCWNWAVFRNIGSDRIYSGDVNLDISFRDVARQTEQHVSVPMRTESKVNSPYLLSKKP